MRQKQSGKGAGWRAGAEPGGGGRGAEGRGEGLTPVRERLAPAAAVRGGRSALPRTVITQEQPKKEKLAGPGPVRGAVRGALGALLAAHGGARTLGL